MTSAQTREKPARTPRDMAISLAVLLVPVFLIVLAYRFIYAGDSIVTVDPSTSIDSAKRAGLTHLPPATAPEGWFVVSAQFRDGVLRIGYLDEDQDGAQLVQSRTDIAATELPRDGETRLVGRSGDVTVVLLGRNADLQKLAATLDIPVSASGSGQ